MVWGVRARGMVLAVVVAGSLLAVCSSAYGTAIAPNTTSDVVGDDGVCSLREAITAAALQTPSGAKPGECPAGTGKDLISLTPGRYVLNIPGAGDNSNFSGDLDIRS